NGNTVEDTIMVIRMTSIALIIVPVQSIIRGYFQGHQSMEPTTISQLVEQILRILFLLGASFFIIKILHGSIVRAVGWSTFAAFVGAIAGLLVLIWYWYSHKQQLSNLIEQDTSESIPSTWSMFKELLMYAVPF